MTLKGGNLRGLNYTLPMASTQVKSAVLLAGLHTKNGIEVIKPKTTRDHTKRMLRAFGAEVIVEDRKAGDKTFRHIHLPEKQKLTRTHVAVPGDPSSAAFPLIAALIVPGSEVTVKNMILNKLHTNLFTTLQKMGTDLVISNVRVASGEEVGDITARYSQLKNIVMPPERAPSMINEYPILAVAAAFASGETVMRGVGEMRVKESDRISLTANGLKTCGIQIIKKPEGFIITGTGQPPKGGATVVTHGDHRIAMSHLILGMAAQAEIAVDEPGMIATSFPGFTDLMRGLGATLTKT